MGVKGGGDVGADCGNSSGGSGASDNDYYRLYNGSSGRVTQWWSRGCGINGGGSDSGSDVVV